MLFSFILQQYTDQFSRALTMPIIDIFGIPIGFLALQRKSAQVSSSGKAVTMTTKDDLFLITGATGKTGAHTVRLLRERGLRVRALVHSLDERADQLAKLGAEV